MITPISFILFVLALLVIDDIAVIYAIMISLILHEAAHGFMLALFGQKFNVLFIPLLGAGVIPSNTEALHSLSKLKLALIAIAGPIINAILLVSALLIGPSLDASWQPLIEQLVMINTSFIIINIGPVAIFDGFKVANQIIQSLESKLIKAFAAIYFFLVGVSSLLYFQSSKEPAGIGAIIFCTALALIFVALMFGRAESDKKSEPMSQGAAIALLVTFFCLSGYNLIWLVQTYLL